MKEIQLTQGQVALVDDNIFEYFSQWKWHAHKDKRNYYAERKVRLANGKQKTIRMHHEVFGSSVKLDHIDSNGLNNQLSNLRIASSVENSRNQNKKLNYSSIYKGVSFHKIKKKWEVRIRAGELLANGYHKKIFLGLFDDEIEAAKAYDLAAIRCFGEFAKTNFPLSEYGR
jgi:hypothetical protein